MNSGGIGEEIGIMSDELLQRLVEEQAPDSVKPYAKASGAGDADVRTLRVDFQSESLTAIDREISESDHNGNISMPRIVLITFADILRINNLWTFTNLRKLQLDNNIIEKIENLELLVNLEWLGS